MGVRMTGSGSYLPSIAVTREDWTKINAEKARYGQIPTDYFDIPEVVQHCNEKESATYMGTQAVLRAIENAGLKPEDIDLVLCFSTIHDNTFPKDGQSIVKMAGLPNATALDIDLACGSFQSLLKVGSAFINQGLNRRVVAVCTANWVHRAIDKTQDYSPLGDGAAAVVLEQHSEQSFIGSMEKNDPRFFNFVRMNSSQTGQAETINFTFTDEFKTFLKTDAVNVAKELMAKTGYMPNKVDWLICHQVGTKALNGWCRNLELAPEKLLSTYLCTGNCMASNMPLVLDYYINQKPCIKRGDVILFYSLSMGYHASALLWRY